MNKWKRNNYRFWHSPIALIILFLILVIFGYKIIDLIQKNKETAHTKELILEKIDALQKKESSLMNDIARLETEEGKEEIIRSKYQVTKEGEKMLTIVDSNNVRIKDEKVSHGFWNWIKRIFDK
jgi:cell division protein FtsB